MSTVPIFAPDGTLGDIPAANLTAAVQAGAKPGVHVTAPDGTAGVIPADRYQDAAKAGAKIEPLTDQPAKDWLSSAGSALWSDLKGMVSGSAKMAPHVLSAMGGDATDLSQDLGSQGSQMAQNWKDRTAANEGLPYKVGAAANEALGVNVKGEEQAAKEGDPGAVLGHAAAVPVAMAASAGLSKAAPAIPGAAATALDVTSEVLNHPIMKAIGKTADVLTFDRMGKIVDAWRKLPGELKARSADAPVYPGATEPSATPEQLNPSLVSPARTLPGQIPPEQVAPNGPIPGVDIRPSIERIMPPRNGLMLPAAPEYPGAMQPQAPSPELLQGNALREGAKPAVDPAKGLSELPVHAVTQAIKELGVNAPLTDITSRAQTIAKLGDLLNQGTGGDKGAIQPGIPMKNQGVSTTKVPDMTQIPEGHTPVDSSALKSYKYTPETQEFESVTQGGQHYIHGNISPDEAAAFEAAPSKGKAWQKIRQSGTLVAKVINGKRVPVKPVVSDEDLISPEEWDAGHELGTEVEGSPR